jgi:hypothetical protein
VKKLLLLVLLAAAPAFGQTATKLVSTWVGAVYPTGTPVCSTTVVTSCQAGYTIIITPPTGAAVTIPSCSPTVVSGCIAAGATTYTWQPGGVLAYGTYQVSLAANGYLSSGAAGSSTPLIASALYAPSITTIPAPSGLTVQFTQ